jgi:hypothetical protein
MGDPSKFAIHEAARDGRSKRRPNLDHATPWTSLLTKFTATVVESLLNVRFMESISIVFEFGSEIGIGQSQAGREKR